MKPVDDVEVWRRLPPQPWAPEVQPSPEQFATWLEGLDHEHLVWIVGKQQYLLGRGERCFTENHEAYIAGLTYKVRALVTEFETWVARDGSRT